MDTQSLLIVSIVRDRIAHQFDVELVTDAVVLRRTRLAAERIRPGGLSELMLPPWLTPLPLLSTARARRPAH